MKKFRELLLAGIDEDIHGTTIERLVKVKEIFEAEMIYKAIKPSAELLTQWLQGLCWAIHVPYENAEIIAWYEKQLKRKAKERKRNYNSASESDRWIEQYWPQLGRTLFEMLYK